MSLPPALRARLVEGLGGSLERTRPLGGGSCCQVALVETPHQRLVLKWHLQAPRGLFEAEADGLLRLRAAGAHAPRPLEWAEPDGACPAFLLLDYLPPPAAPLPPARWGAQLGEALANLHRADQPATYGLERDNFIGTLPQRNTPTSRWPDLWWEHRIQPQLELAAQRRTLRPPLLQALQDLRRRAADLLPDSPHPALLHGDLWSGNVLLDHASRFALIDPAVYRGDREVDLAMAALFGGFPPAFFDAYRGAWPLEPGAETRQRLYQAYPLLVHANLFGGRYPKDLAATLEPWLR